MLQGDFLAAPEASNRPALFNIANFRIAADSKAANLLIRVPSNKALVSKHLKDCIGIGDGNAAH